MYVDEKEVLPWKAQNVKRKTFQPNLTSALTILAIFAIGSLGCSRIRELTKLNRQSDKVNEFNFTVPYGFRSADLDPSNRPDERITILLTEDRRIHVENIETEPVDLHACIQWLVEAGPQRLPVYVAAAGGLDSSFFLDFVNELRKKDLDEIHLMVGPTERPIDPSYDESPRYVSGMGDIPFPDHSFSLKLRSSDTSADDSLRRPNPLILVVKRYASDAYTLNSEPVEDENELSSKLANIFKRREDNGVFRENSNEIEKTVWLDPTDEESRNKQEFTYWHILKMIDAVRAAGSSPIVLTDGDVLLTVADHEPPALKAPARTAIPKTVSGGILNGKAASLPKPEVPPAARAVRASGAVTVQVTVDLEGKVVEAKAVSGHPLLRNSAEQAAKAARFAPTILAGQKVSVTGVIVYNFAP